MGFITLYLALTNPDYLVVEEDQYRVIKSDLRAQPASASSPDSAADPENGTDGEH
jgi:hypothetical protein